MSNTQHPNHHLDFRFAASIGNSYFALAKPLLDKLKLSANITSQPLGDYSTVFSTATNIALALELYLKAIRIGLKMSIPDTHNLWTLYKHLPVDIKTTLESIYDSKLTTKPAAEVLDLEICIQRGGTPADPIDAPSSCERSKSLPALLKRSASMFVAWRYVFESVPENKKFAFFLFEYNHLRWACEALIEFLQQGERELSRQSIINHKN